MIDYTFHVMNEEPKQYLNNEIDIVQYLEQKREEGLLKLTGFTQARKGGNFIALIGDTRHPNNLGIVIGRAFGSKAFTGAIHSANSFTFYEGLMEFDFSKLRIYEGEIIPKAKDLINKELSELINYLEA